VAWILALDGILYLITTSLEAASRFHPGNLKQFIQMEKATGELDPSFFNMLIETRAKRQLNS
jgi:hypothetical protein